MKFISDFHTHTIASGHAYSTIDDLVDVAKRRGIKYLAITDHGPDMPGGPHIYHFGNLKILPNEINGVNILKGVEANIINPKGDIDLPDYVLERLDIVLVGFHTGSGYDPGTKLENTKALIGAIKNRFVDIVVHPGNPEYEIDLDRVIEVAKKEDVLLEINNSSYISRPGSRKRCIEIAKKCKKAGMKVVFGSDTHYKDQVGSFKKSMEIFREAELEKDDILNISQKEILKFLEHKRKLKKGNN
ncbi:MAG: phosphatase [Fusobacteriota bacterium]